MKGFFPYGFVLINLLLYYKGYTQELSGLKENEPFSINGGVGVNGVVYQSNDTLHTRDPFTYVFTGNLNTSIYGVVNCPLSFTYSNYNSNFSQPFNFNQFGAQPSYKWIKTYLGYNSMTFSNYSLNGHQFLGAGVEISPEKVPVRAGAMYGRLLRAVKEDTLNPSNIPSFSRYGYAVKLGYCPDGDEYSISLFKGWDNLASLDTLPVKTEIKPGSNLVLNALVAKKITERFVFNGEIATSILNSDTRLNDEEKDESLYKATRGLIHTNSTTSNSKAYKASVRYTGQTYSLGTTYEYIDPEYQTMGAYYFTNDLENITLDFAKRLLKEKISLSGRIGFQRDNINGTKLAANQRIVGNLNTNYAISQKTTLNLTYSNFTGYTHIRNNFEQINETNPYQHIDTLTFTQINQSISGNISFLIGNPGDKEKQQSVNFMVSMQQASSEQGDEKLPGTRFYNSNLAYNINFPVTSLSLFGSLNYNYNELPESSDQSIIGPTFGCNKSYFEKKLKLTSSVSYNSTFDGDKNTEIWVLRNNGSLTVKEKHQFNLSVLIQNRPYYSEKRMTDFTLTFGYKFSFNTTYHALFSKDI
jgi:hypothetical protein